MTGCLPDNWSEGVHAELVFGGTSTNAHFYSFLRSDIAFAGLAGFRLIAPVAWVKEHFSVRLRGVGDELVIDSDCETQFVSGRARGYIESVDDWRVAGWVEKTNAFCDKQPVQVELTINGAVCGKVEPGDWQRNDVVAECFSLSPQVGFAIDLDRIALPSALADAISDGTVVDLGLRCGAQDFGNFRWPIVVKPIGCVELVDDNLVGWATRAPFRDAPCEVEIVINGIAFHRLRANVERDDLKRAGLVRRGGGWRVRLPSSPSREPILDIRVLILPERFELTPLLCERPSAAPPFVRGEIGSRPLDIVLRARQGENLDVSLEALALHTTVPARLFVAARRESVLDIEALLHSRNFDSNCRVVLDDSLATEIDFLHDVVLLDSDTVVTPRWLEYLLLAARAQKNIALVEPMVDALERGKLVAVDGRARVLAKTAKRIWPEVVFSSWRCVLVNSDAIAAYQAAGHELNLAEDDSLFAFALWARHNNWRHICEDATFVATVGANATALLTGPPVAETDETALLSRLTEADFPALVAAYGLRASRGIASDLASPLPRVLFVISTTGGGTPATNGDLMLGLRDNYDCWLLRCDCETITLLRPNENGHQVAATHRLLKRIEPVTHRSAEYDAVLASWLMFFAIELVHLRHLAWHSLGLPETCRKLGIPVINSFHDFYAVCPALKLLDDHLAHCAGVCTSGEGTCQIDLWDATDLPPLKHHWVEQWRRNLRHALKACDAFVTTCETARQLLTRAHPFLGDTDFRIIPHGRAFDITLAPSQVRRLERPYRILVPGSISVAKGARIITALRDYDLRGLVEFHILGDCDNSLTGDRIVRHGGYARQDFHKHAQRINAHFGAIFSVWPETHCHTLTELWNAGLPVIAFDLGAVGERIRASGAGLIVSHTDGIPKLFSEIISLAMSENRLGALLAAVGAWQRGEGAERNLTWMAEHYLALYRDVLVRRRGLMRVIPTAFPADSRAIN